MTSRNKIVDEAVAEYQKIKKSARPSKRMQKRINLLNYDLYYGPLSKEDAASEGFLRWRGFSEELATLRSWIEETYPSDLYYNADFGGVMDNEPEPWYDEDSEEWIEPDYENWYHLEYRDIAEGLLGKELASYL